MKTLSKIHGPARERGVVLLFCLIILVVLLAGGVAVMRSMDTSLVGAGNLAFKRDLVNQGELAIAKAMREFQASGALAATGSDFKQPGPRQTTARSSSPPMPKASRRCC